MSLRGKATKGMRRGPHTQRASRSPTTRDLEWAAGFLEGEGTFRQSDKRFARGGQTVVAKQVNPEPLERLLAVFGGRLRMVQFPNRPKWQDCWVWQVYGARARGVMMTLYTLLSGKRRDQIRKALVGRGDCRYAAA